MKKVIALTIVVSIFFSISADSVNLIKPEKNDIETTSVQIIDGEEFSVTTYAPLNDTKRTIFESDTSIVIGEYFGLNYKITETQKDEYGNLIPESQVVYSGTYSDPYATNTVPNSELVP